MMRSRWLQRHGAWGALFALTLQLVLGFGHMHPLPAAASSGVAVAAQHPGGGSDSPSDAALDICAICVAMQLANTANLPPPAALPAPVLRSFDAIALDGRTFARPRLPSLPFQTRAPPTA